MSCILCIDIGTSRIKAALVNERGELTELRSERLARASSPDTQDALVWRDAAIRLLRGLAEKVRAEKPLAVSLTGNMHAMLCIGADGQPLADAMLWCSNAASEESAELKTRYPRFAETYGNVPAPVFALPKLLMCARKTPELYRKTKVFLQPKDYIGAILTGVFATDPSDASGVMPFLPDERRWDTDLIRKIGLDPEKFPQVIESAALRGTVTPDAAAQTGLPAGLPVICGAGDLATAAIGCGACGSVLSLTLGTAGQLLASGPRGRWRGLAGKLFVFSHADPAYDLYLGSVPGGGFSLEWEASRRGMTMEQFFQAADSAPLKPDLPVYLPYLLGRGAPYMDYVPCASWTGIGAHHSIADLCRATVFGPIAALRQSADLLSKLTDHNFDTVVLQSLACREKAVRDTACALFPQEKRMPSNTEASLLGAAVIGAVATGIYSGFTNAIQAMVQTAALPSASPEETQAAAVLFNRYLAAAEKVKMTGD